MVRIRPMTAADLPDGLRLSEQAGWNQGAADWSRFLELQPDGCFVAELDGRPVGTVTTCLLGPVAWIAMMLVQADLRGRGIGRSLMTHALAFLETQGARSIRLDATPLGRPLYESLGFVADNELARHRGTPVAVAAGQGGEPPRPDQESSWLALDRDATGTDRAKLLRRLGSEFPGSCRVVNRDGCIAGFIFHRPGRLASQVGPCIAVPDSGAGPDLLHGAFDRLAGQPIFLDIPIGHTVAESVAASRGLTVQRTLLRMSLGERVPERPGWLWASSGPEMG